VADGLKRHRRFSLEGTWDRIMRRCWLRPTRAGCWLDWTVSVDSTVNRAHQHATTFARVEGPAARRPRVDTGGLVELHESERGAG
jgi:hypothetical protein